MSLKLFNFFSLLFISMMLAGCFASYPMGVSEETWLSLSSEKKAELRAKQYEIDEQRRIEAQRAIDEEKKRIEMLYQNAKFGDIIVVNIYQGEYKTSKEWLDIEPTSVMLVRGESKQIELTLRNKKGYSFTHTLEINLDTFGNKLSISPKYDNDKLIILNNGKWAREQRYLHSYDFSKYNQIKNTIFGIRYY